MVADSREFKKSTLYLPRFQNTRSCNFGIQDYPPFDSKILRTPSGSPDVDQNHYVFVVFDKNNNRNKHIFSAIWNVSQNSQAKNEQAAIGRSKLDQQQCFDLRPPSQCFLTFFCIQLEVILLTLSEDFI